MKTYAQSLVSKVHILTRLQDNEGAEHGSDDDDLASDSGSFSEVDDLSGTFALLVNPFIYLRLFPDDEGAAHLHELSKLAEKDPEFYKYLQEHDRELLEFNPDKLDEDTMMGDEDEEMEQTPILTKEILKSWQKALLEVCLCIHWPFRS